MPIDETRYLSVAWEMWQQENFLVPHSNGAPYSHKPPLLFWCIHLVWALFGVTETGARLVAPLFGLATLFVSGHLARRLWPQKPGVASLVPYALLGLPFWALTGTLTMFDMPLAFFALAGVWGIVSAARGQSLWG
jgi:4-amino-4-deoxy-L-arabinose transferase-like glycosyltransferase